MTVSTFSPPSLAHLVIYNPTLRPSSSSNTVAQASNAESSQGAEDRDKDLEDDLREAAQIAFYTSTHSNSVSRDTMLKQTGLVKGLTGFADMITRDSASSFTSISSSKSRLIVWNPEPDWFIYVNIALSTTISEVGKVEPSPTAQGISDQTIVSALSRGYGDFKVCLLSSCVQA